MFGLSTLERPEVQQIATQGSPKLLSMVGRAFGLGQAEQQALVKGQFPTWLFLAAGLATGFFVGIEVEKRWPGKVLGGKRKR